VAFSVGVHPPKTPVTSGSRGTAKVTLPNICKMPGVPFTPTHLPNVGKSELSPKGYSKTVKIEGCTVAILGASFESIGDIASKATGGGLISANTHGPTKFITPGSLTVKIEGKNVHLLGEPMLNNCGPTGIPPNTGATMQGEDQEDSEAPDAEKALQDIICECNRLYDDVQKTRDPKANCRKLGEEKHDCCNDGINLHNKQGKSPQLQTEQGYNEASGAHDPLASRKWPRGASPEQYFRSIAGKIFPDGAVLDAAGNVDQFVEFKFQCPAGTPTRKDAEPSEGTAKQGWTPARGKKKDQLTRTKRLGGRQNPKVTKEPMLLTNEKCPKK
jgi:uncharacterized Zn-binding protein involved in type VI secretion